ncbi:MAG: ChaN family lipoprotein, partial [Pseudobdellovibrionaceae bacterium]|nr:ChaN family lipoprotein [Pseudobdellovibrionaceae bacterium]
AVQRQVLDLLGQKSQLGSVTFEQAHWDQQTVLTALNNRSLGELAKDLQWKNSGWPDFKFYEPLFLATVRYRAQAIAGNINPQKTKLVYQQGYAAIFQADEQKNLGLDRDLEPQAQAALEDEIFQGHCQMLPKDHVKTMIPVQRTRDAAMALAWLRQHKQGKSVFIVGAGHARKDFGIPLYLKRLKPDLKIYSIGMNEMGAESPAAVYDQIITTAPAQREDPCAGLKEKFSKPKS